MAGRDIFISYSREDRTAARHFAECFEQEGFSVWWDAALQSGETFDEVIESELKAAHAVVVLWSPRSVTSRWVRAEATMADRRKKLAPVLIEPCDLPIIFELTHTVDLSDWTGDRADDPWPAFVSDLHRLVERGRQAGGPASPRAASAPAANRFAPRPAERVAEKPDREQLSRGKVDELMMALTSLRDSIAPPAGAPAPPARANPEPPSENTQIYTGTSEFDLFGADEFHCLEITIGERLEKRFVVSPLGVKIGRSKPADIILADARVSRTHCLVELADDRLRVTDLRSTNGTYIDGKRIDGEAYLAIGSVLKVGNIALSHALRTRADV